MGLETFALINDKDQVINHIVVDKEASNFEEVMAGQLEHWGCIRYVETDVEQPIIIHEDETIWTTHTEEEGFILPDMYYPKPEPIAGVVKKKSELPADSLLLEENKANRPEGWVWPEHLTVVEG